MTGIDQIARQRFLDEALPASLSTRSARVDSVDVVRGVIMIVMALDHVRDFFGAPGNPTDPVRASAALFFTRWITHFCAPVFFLLTGTSAFFVSTRRSRGQLSRWLFTRGFWLIVVELTILRCLGYQFNFDYRLTMLVVLWALGWAMITLAGLVWVPMPAIVAFGLALIALHNLFDGVQARTLGWFGPFWLILHSPGVVTSTPQYSVFVSYPLVPWIGVTAVGFGLGAVLRWPAEPRRRFLLTTGALITMAFAGIRWLNVYGDPVPWSVQSTVVRTMLSFLNANKYPPSLAFLLMTLGPALLSLRTVDRAVPNWLRLAQIVGRVPMFYFLVHLPLIHLAAVAVCYALNGDAHWMFQSPSLDKYPFTRPPGWGFSLPIVYGVWIALVLALYPACVWFASVKKRRADWWLRYL